MYYFFNVYIEDGEAPLILLIYSYFNQAKDVTDEGRVTEDDDNNNNKDDENDGILVKEEEKEEGVVKFSVYWAYWMSVGMILAPLVLLSLFLMQGMEWVWQWVEHLQYLIIDEYAWVCGY